MYTQICVTWMLINTKSLGLIAEISDFKNSLSILLNKTIYKHFKTVVSHPSNHIPVVSILYIFCIIYLTWLSNKPMCIHAQNIPPIRDCICKAHVNPAALSHQMRKKSTVHPTSSCGWQSQVKIIHYSNTADSALKLHCVTWPGHPPQSYQRCLGMENWLLTDRKGIIIVLL